MAQAQKTPKIVESAKYDLTAKFTPHLDIQLVFPMLDRLYKVSKNTDGSPNPNAPYSPELVLRTQIHLLEKHAVSVNGVSACKEKWEELYGNKHPRDFNNWSLEMQTLFESRIKSVHNLKLIMDTPEFYADAQKASSLEDCSQFLPKLMTKEGQTFNEGEKPLDAEEFEAFYEFGRWAHDAYLYELARNVLDMYKTLAKCWGLYEDLTLQRKLNLEYGRIAPSIITSQWDVAASDMLKLDDFFEQLSASGRINNLDLLQQRTALLHWMLFVCFIPRNDQNRASAQNSSNCAKVLDLFLSEKYFNLMSLRFPYMLRYVSAAYIMNPKLRYMVKDILHVLNEDRDRYKDPVTELLLSLFQDFDFEAASANLKECMQVCEIDYWLQGDAATFHENARMLVFDTYCKIHQSVDIKRIGEMMCMSAGECEEWIVNLIQKSGKLSARIDTSDENNKAVIMDKSESDVYEQVYEKTREMGFRLYMLERIKETLVTKNLDPTSMSAEIAKHLQPPKCTVSSFLEDMEVA